jgi:hypothetical protein
MTLFYDPAQPTRGALAVPQGTFATPITEAEFRALIESLSPIVPTPDWEAFAGQILADADFNTVLATAIAAAPAAALGLPAALAQVADKGVGQFSQIYPVVCTAGGATVQMRTRWRGYAEDANLPVEFVELI